MGKDSVLRVTGKGMLRLKPDTTRVTITLVGCYKEYGEALKRSSTDTESLKEEMAKLGFASGDLKTLSFQIQMRHESYETKDHIWKERLVGYEFRHVMKVDFPRDNERLGQILYALAHSKTEPELQFSFTVKDTEAAKNELIGAAVADAKAKAEVLAKASGVKLGGILRIDYSMYEPDFECRPMNGAFLTKAMGAARDMSMESYSMDIEPEDIEVTDTVTVVWTIGGKGAAKAD